MTVASAAISSLGYIGVSVADPDAFADYATGVLGLMAAPADGETRRFRIDEQAWRIAVDQGERNDLAYVGFEVRDAAALDALYERVTRSGVQVLRGDAGLCEQRGVIGLAHCRDPDGLRVEFYFGPDERQDLPFVSPAGVSGFVTEGQGLGHVALGTGDISAARTFYRDVLGFHLSDIISIPVAPDRTLDLEFYHCNPRHHTLALVPVASPKRLHHFMLQTRTLDDVGFALDRHTAGGHALARTLGKHSNDHMVSFYGRVPGGFEVEYGWGARDVAPESWRVVRHGRTSIWGHKAQRAPH